MSDDLTKKRPQDANKVNIHEEWELNYWSKHFGVSKAALIQAVKTVGVDVRKVGFHLGYTG